MSHKKVTALSVREDRALFERNGCDCRVYYNLTRASKKRVDGMVNNLPWKNINLIILPNGFIAEDRDSLERGYDPES